MWYDNSRLLSHNMLMNFIISNRGDGKTFNAKKWCINDFLKTGAQFVWVRRYKSELKKRSKFFDDIKHLFPNNELVVKGWSAYIDGKEAGVFVALSTSKIEKSTPYPLTNKIIFDEFIITKGAIHYLSNEVEEFLDLIETVQRIRDNVRVQLISNNVSVVNPYFSFWNLRIDHSKRFNVFKDRSIVVEYFTDNEFIEKKLQTRFGKLVSGTKYGDYAILNKPLMDNDVFIEKRTPVSEFTMGIKYNDVMYGFWVDYKAGYIYVNTQYDPSSYALYSITKDDHEPNLLLIKSLSTCKPMQRIVYCFQEGLIRFDNMTVKNQFYEFISYFVR